MQNLQFPIEFTFKIGTLANDFKAMDGAGRIVAYARQKMFKLKEDIIIFSDESKTEELYRIRADKWIDFSTAYAFTDVKTGQTLGRVARKGWRSIWKARYEIISEQEEHQYSINERNGWVKIWDSLLSEIPILGIFTGYLFNPSYSVSDLNGEERIRLRKKPSFFGRRFELTEIKKIESENEVRVMLALMVMILLERRRG
ncbi:MAG TPA: hypothetical protein DCR93_38760 [Cytophagales bacterium]|nr:hypothetical protein [Cytophagales bacterium]HAP65177.1 hypothetical protein [Cytophagales bacterium]